MQDKLKWIAEFSWCNSWLKPACLNTHQLNFSPTIPCLSEEESNPTLMHVQRALILQLARSNNDTSFFNLISKSSFRQVKLGEPISSINIFSGQKSSQQFSGKKTESQHDAKKIMYHAANGWLGPILLSEVNLITLRWSYLRNEHFTNIFKYTYAEVCRSSVRIKLATIYSCFR